MIERVYIDNVRTFVNFEWRPERLGVLLGPNGAGKTALFDVVAKIQAFAAGETSTKQAFPRHSRTRWDGRNEQTVELDVRGNAGLYRYRLEISHFDEDGRIEVGREVLTFDGRPLAELAKGALHLYPDAGGRPVTIPGKSSRSGIGAVEAGKGNKLFAWFKAWLWNIWVLRPDPRAMRARLETDGGTRDQWLKPDFSNFADWYVGTIANKPGSMFKAMHALGEVLPGFTQLREEGGQLVAQFASEAEGTIDFSLDELSDGQRALIGLYFVLHTTSGPGKVIFVDEPDNYVALREIQPWLMEVTERALSSQGPQVVLVSHHPEVLNLLAVEYGWRLIRDRNGPTRSPKRFETDGKLDPAESIARGWEDDGER